MLCPGTLRWLLESGTCTLFRAARPSALQSCLLVFMLEQVDAKHQP